MFDGYLGGGTAGVVNTVTAHYRYKETTESWGAQTWNSITAVNTSGTISFNDYINGDLGSAGFDTEKSYNIEVRIFDKLSQQLVETTLDKGTPLVEFHKNRGVSIGDSFDTDNTAVLQVVGDTQMTGNLLINEEDIYSGWKIVTETWTRTGNHTFTVVGDLTAKYRKGTKVRYKDGGAFEYGVIGSSVYGAVTTITLITNTDYTMSATTITDTAISYIENPEGFPFFFNYTPTFTGFSSDPGVSISRWFVQHSWVTVIHRESSNGTSNSSAFTFSLPVAAADVTLGLWIVPGMSVINNGTESTIVGRVQVTATGTTASVFRDMASLAWTSSGSKRLVSCQLSYPF
jgi:hypothetical protein